MHQDRIKTLFWVCLLKVLQPCLARRRPEYHHIGTAGGDFARLGRLCLPGEGWGWGRNRRELQSAGPASRRRTFIDDCHGLTLPSGLERTNLDGADSVRPVSVAGGRWRPKEETKQSQQEATPASSNREHSIRLTNPLISIDAWEEMTGTEFEDEDMVEALARSSLELCAQEESNAYVEWTMHKDTEKILKTKDRTEALEDGEVLVSIGKAKQPEAFAAGLPFIKTQSILPLSAEDMADLLMDSSRVKIYNKMSVGRKDIKQLSENTKVVRNLTQPPIAKSQVVAVTLLHSRPLREEDHPLLKGPYKEGYLVVSRSVPAMMDEEELVDLPRSDILLGVNLLQDVGPNECMMTAITHVYSPVLPTMLARSVGVSSAINFVRDIRKACESALAK